MFFFIVATICLRDQHTDDEKMKQLRTQCFFSVNQRDNRTDINENTKIVCVVTSVPYSSLPIAKELLKENIFLLFIGLIVPSQ